MPRLDNSNRRTRRVLESWSNVWANLKGQDMIPGDTPPADVCWNCWDEIFSFCDTGGVAHPPYGEGEYTCTVCGEDLTEDDDFPNLGWVGDGPDRYSNQREP